jgi:hypothetical protein
VSLLKRKPGALKPSQVAIEVNLDLPDALFRRPRIITTITVPSGDIPVEIINHATIERIEDAMRGIVGMDVRVQLVDLTTPDPQPVAVEGQ